MALQTMNLGILFSIKCEYFTFISDSAIPKCNPDGGPAQQPFSNSYNLNPVRFTTHKLYHPPPQP